MALRGRQKPPPQTVTLGPNQAQLPAPISCSHTHFFLDSRPCFGLCGISTHPSTLTHTHNTLHPATIILPRNVCPGPRFQALL